MGVRLHDLRHTAASIAVGRGINLPVIGWLLGHTQAQTTMRYAHVDKDPAIAAANSIGTAVGGALGVLLVRFFIRGRQYSSRRFADLQVRKEENAYNFDEALRLAEISQDPSGSRSALDQRQKGNLMVSNVPQLSLKKVYPELIGPINLNTCGDPDCGNYGVAPDPIHAAFRGAGGSQRRLIASISNPALAAGLGRYRLGTPSERTSWSRRPQSD